MPLDWLGQTCTKPYHRSSRGESLRTSLYSPHNFSVSTLLQETEKQALVRCGGCFGKSSCSEQGLEGLS